MKINKKDFPPIRILLEKKPFFLCDSSFEINAEVRKLIERLVTEGRRNIYTVSKSIETMAASNRARLMDYYLNETDAEAFSGAFIDTSMNTPSMEIYKFLPKSYEKWKDGERDDIYTYIFASFQGDKKTGDVVLAAMGIIKFIYTDEGIECKLHIQCHEGDEQNCVKYMKFLLETNVFLKYADKEVITIYGKQRKMLPDKSDYIDNKSGVPIRYIDSRWLREIIRLEGFKVKGHFRLQPYKDEAGEWTRRLIYINEFEKHGYHRRAQRDIEARETY